jgi:nicotinamide mononucleotide transporter
MLTDIWHQFIVGIRQTTLLEFTAVSAGITSVWLSKKENILLYPIGLVNTVIYIYISIKGKLFGEASVNLYYTIMSIYGWILWSRKDKIKHQTILHITYSNKKEWIQQVAFFISFYIIIYFSLTWLKNNFAPGAIPLADAFASSTAYTAMWLMAKKKMENWHWWIATNTASIPLYFVKGYVFTSVQFIILLALAFAGLYEWIKKEKT